MQTDPQHPGRIVVFGDVDFAHNGLLDQGGNRDLFINAVNWLADDVGQVGERAARQPAGVKQFYLTDQPRPPRFFIVSTAILPGFFLLIGVGVFVWRRRARMSWRRIGLYYGLGGHLWCALSCAFVWDPAGEGPRIGEAYAPAQSRFLPFSRESVQELEAAPRRTSDYGAGSTETAWRVIEPEGGNVYLIAGERA